MKKMFISSIVAAILLNICTVNAVTYNKEQVSECIEVDELVIISQPEQVMNIYSTDSYEFFTYSDGLGHSYRDISLNNRNNADEREKFYEALLNACLGFSKSYADLEPTKYSLGGGESVTYNQLPGTQNTGYDFTYTDAEEVYYTFRNDHPEFYWLSNNFHGLASSSGEIFPVPVIDNEYISGSMRSCIDKRIQKSADWYLSAADAVETDAEKILMLYDMIIESTEYNWADDAQTIVGDESYAHSIIGVLDGDLSTNVVCEGYAKAFNLLLNGLDIDNLFVGGWAYPYGDNDAHAWNMAAIDGKYYYFDLTWDDAGSGNAVAHDYFAKGEELFSKEHYPDSDENTSIYFQAKLPEVSSGDYSPVPTVKVPEPRPDMGDVTKGTMDVVTEITKNENGTVKIKADTEIPGNGRMYLAVYDTQNILIDTAVVTQRESDVEVAAQAKTVKVFVFGENQQPLAYMSSFQL